jgi:hypothetical protein
MNNHLVWKLLASLAAFLISSATLRAADKPPRQLVTTFGEQEVVTTGAHSGASVIFYSIGLEPQGFEPLLLRWNGVVTADRDGKAVFATERHVPLKSIWVIADLSDNTFNVATPPGFALQEVLTVAVKKGKTQHNDRMALQRPFADALLITHSGGKTFIFQARDGGVDDDDATTDGWTTLGLAHGKGPSDGNSIPPLDLTSGDVLFVIDFTRMEINVTTVDDKILKDAH